MSRPSGNLHLLARPAGMALDFSTTCWLFDTLRALLDDAAPALGEDLGRRTVLLAGPDLAAFHDALSRDVTTRAGAVRPLPRARTRVVIDGRELLLHRRVGDHAQLIELVEILELVVDTLHAGGTLILRPA